MSSRKIAFANGEYYHVYNRGVDHREIFLSNEDFDRFLEGLSAFNAPEPIYSLQLLRARQQGCASAVATLDPLVRILAFCLNPNHFHLLLEQVADHGVERFMQRIGTGYTMYFNKKMKRSGALFQGKFKATHIDTNEYLLHASVYINLNNCVHRIPGDRFRSSWSSYVEDHGASAILSRDGIIINQFEHRNAYRQYAEHTLPVIQERKDYLQTLDV